ncbi:MAG: hypothetical protein EOP51_31145, partial [Sphingobacteriales bacterium]
MFVVETAGQKIRKIELTGFTLNSPLPAGLNFDGTTGTISGTPTVGSGPINYSITGINSAGKHTVSANIAVTPNSPAITSFSPAIAGQNQYVSIYGTDLIGVTSVTIGGVAANFNSISPGILVAQLGAGASGSIVVTTIGGSANIAGFTYATAPAISYTTPQTFTTTNAVIPLLPSNTGGLVPEEPYGTISTYAGSGAASSNPGTYLTASFYNPTSIATDGAFYYVVDQSSGAIRKIDRANGAVTTIAGQSTFGYVDGFGTAAMFSAPNRIVYDGTGNLYVSEISNGRIRKIVISTGLVTTIAGNGSNASVDGTGTNASLFSPSGLALDGQGNLYVGESNGRKIRKIVLATGVVSTVAGNGISASTDGPALSASFGNINDLAWYNGNLYISDAFPAIRKLDLTSNEVSTIAGSSTSGSTDGVGTAATFASIKGINADGSCCD